MVSVTPFDKKIGTILINNPCRMATPTTFVTQNYNPDGKSGVRDAHPLLVQYPDPGAMIFKETVNNSDFTTGPLNSSFNLLIFSS